MKVKFSKLHPDAVIPSYAKPGDAGLDLTAVAMTYVRTDQVDFYEYDLGLACEIPQGYVGLIFPRSSITKTDLFLSNAVGVIDAGFRGRLSARFRKTTGSPHVYKVGERIAQMVIIPYPTIEVEEVSYSNLSETERGSGGWGSSGK